MTPWLPSELRGGMCRAGGGPGGPGLPKLNLPCPGPGPQAGGSQEQLLESAGVGSAGVAPYKPFMPQCRQAGLPPHPPWCARPPQTGPGWRRHLRSIMGWHRVPPLLGQEGSEPGVAHVACRMNREAMHGLGLSEPEGPVQAARGLPRGFLPCPLRLLLGALQSQGPAILCSFKPGSGQPPPLGGVGLARSAGARGRVGSGGPFLSLARPGSLGEGRGQPWGSPQPADSRQSLESPASTPTFLGPACRSPGPAC